MFSGNMDLVLKAVLIVQILLGRAGSEGLGITAYPAGEIYEICLTREQL